MKKRILTLALTLLLLVSMAVPALAAEINQDTVAPKTAGTTLTYEVDSTYTVTIPAAVTITSGTGSGTISVADSVIDFEKSLTVTITDATNYDAGFRLKDGINDNYIAYTIANGATTVVKDTAFLTVASGTAIGSAELTYTAAAPTKSGTYTDTLTFTVAVG